jgi:hypothetical protein
MKKILLFFILLLLVPVIELKAQEIITGSSGIEMVYYDKYGSQIKEYFSLKNNLPYDVTDIKIRISYFVNNNDINYKDVSLNGIIPSGLTKKYEIDSFDEDRMFVFADGNDNNKSRYTEFKIKYSVLDYKKYQPNELKNNDILADTITPNSMTDKYYIAYVTTAVNLRDAPSIDSNIIDKIPAKKFIFINSADKIGNYYHVIYIDKDIEGYVNSPALREEILVAEVVRDMIGAMVDDVLTFSRSQLKNMNISSPAEARLAGKQIVSFSPEMDKDVQEMRDFLSRRMYHHYTLERIWLKVSRIIPDLFNAFMDQYMLLPETWQNRVEVVGGKTDETARARVVADYIAGMTDRYAIREHERLFDLYWDLK